MYDLSLRPFHRDGMTLGEIITALRQGKSATVIAELNGTNNQNIKQIADLWNIEPKVKRIEPKRKRAIGRKELVWDDIKKERANGATVNAICKKYHISPRTYYKWGCDK